VLLGFFRQCLVYFLKRYLATHRRIKLSHICQTLMPKVRVENVEDEECCNSILLKCPTMNKEFKIPCCLTIWLICPIWLFLDVVWLFSQKVSGNPAAANIPTPKGKKFSTASEVYDRFTTNQNDISVELQSLCESSTTYVRCFEVIYTRQQNAILQPG